MQAYNKFQELGIMSLLQLLQESTQANDLVLKNYLALRALEQRKILQVLSAALIRSVSAFRPPAPSPNLHTPAPAHAHDASPVIEIPSDSEELPVGNQLKLNLKNPHRRVQPVISILTKNKVLLKSHEQNPTSAENHPEEPSRKPKTKPIKKQKDRRDHRNDSLEDCSQVELPVLDQLEAARLSGFGLGAAEVKQRREALLRRRVAVWGAPVKQDKRELRMLAH